MIYLKTVQKTNPNDREAPAKYYVTAPGQGDVDLDKIAARISEKCTLTEPDVHAVLHALTIEMTDLLSEGKIIRMGTFGSFQLGVKSHGVDTEEEISRHQVKAVNVRFRPGRRIKNALSSLRFSVAE